MTRAFARCGFKHPSEVRRLIVDSENIEQEAKLPAAKRRPSSGEVREGISKSKHKGFYMGEKNSIHR